MAEIWPKLKKKLSGEGRRMPQKWSSRSKKPNPYASSGLEKFAALLEGLQASNASSFVERTASSVSAARSISRSAQEWTALTLVRNASRRSETKLLCNATKSLEAAKPSHSGSEGVRGVNPNPSPCPGPSPSPNPNPNPNSPREIATTSAAILESAVVGDLHKDSGKVQQSPLKSEVVSPVGVRLPGRPSPCRSLKRIRRWRQTSNSAFVVLVALGAFISSRFGKVGKPLAAVLTFSAVVRIWRKGRLYARFIFSSVALYFLTPLRSYLTHHVPRRLSLLPCNLKVISGLNSCFVTEEPEIEVQEPEIEVQEPEIETKQSAPNLSLLLTIPESSASAPEIESLPAIVLYQSSGASSPSRLAKKISSKFKKLKIFRSSRAPSDPRLSNSGSSHSGTHSAATSQPGSPISSGSHSSGSFRKCPSARRLQRTKAEVSSDHVSDGHGDEATATSTSHTIDRKPSGCRKCLLRRQQSSENISCTKKSRLCRILSSETKDQFSPGEPAASPRAPSLPASRSPPVQQESRNDVSWPMVGLFVMLLFLLVGRVPAIMATSLFLVVVSEIHHDRAHHRGRGRDVRALEAAARKLHSRSPPPRGRRFAGSPPRRV